MHRRWITLLVSLTLTAGPLAGCGGEGSEATTGTTATPGPAAAGTPDEASEPDEPGRGTSTTDPTTTVADDHQFCTAVSAFDDAAQQFAFAVNIDDLRSIATAEPIAAMEESLPDAPAILGDPIAQLLTVIRATQLQADALADPDANDLESIRFRFLEDLVQGDDLETLADWGEANCPGTYPKLSGGESEAFCDRATDFNHMLGGEDIDEIRADIAAGLDALRDDGATPAGLVGALPVVLDAAVTLEGLADEATTKEQFLDLVADSPELLGGDALGAFGAVTLWEDTNCA